MSKGDNYILNGSQFEAFKKASLDGVTRIIHFKNFGVSIAHVVGYECIDWGLAKLSAPDMHGIEITDKQREENKKRMQELREKLFRGGNNGNSVI